MCDGVMNQQAPRRSPEWFADCHLVEPLINSSLHCLQLVLIRNNNVGEVIQSLDLFFDS